MDSGTGNTIGATTTIGKMIFIILALVALYYLYRFLYGGYDTVGTTVLKGVKSANPQQPYITTAPSIPPLMEGGEYSVNFWMYVQDYSINRGRNKHVVSLGGSNFLTLAVYLGPFKNSLQVRVHTSDQACSNGLAGTPTNGTPSPNATNTPDNLCISTLPTIFGNAQLDTSLLSATRPCDIQSVDMQKWVQISVILNNKTCDVYMDGKLARSCVLPSFYRVSQTGQKINVCDFGGFGGYVSNVSVYNYSLNPEQVWRLYMSGPGPNYGIGDYIASLFDPNALGATDYPKQNIPA